MRQRKLVEDAARLDDARINDVVESFEPDAMYRHETGVAQEREMLGDIGLRNAKGLDQFLDRHFLLPEQVQYLQALGIGEDLVRLGVLLVCSSRKGFLDLHSF